MRRVQPPLSASCPDWRGRERRMPKGSHRFEQVCTFTPVFQGSWRNAALDYDGGSPIPPVMPRTNKPFDAVDAKKAIPDRAMPPDTPRAPTSPNALCTSVSAPADLPDLPPLSDHKNPTTSADCATERNFTCGNTCKQFRDARRHQYYYMSTTYRPGFDACASNVAVVPTRICDEPTSPQGETLGTAGDC